MRNDRLLKRLVAYGITITRVECFTNESLLFMCAVRGYSLFECVRGFVIIQWLCLSHQCWTGWRVRSAGAGAVGSAAFCMWCRILFVGLLFLKILRDSFSLPLVHVDGASCKGHELVSQ